MRSASFSGPVFGPHRPGSIRHPRSLNNQVARAKTVDRFRRTKIGAIELATITDYTRLGQLTKGPVYVVSIAGAKMYSLNPQSAEQADVRIGDTQPFQVVDVSTDRLTFRTFDATGRRLDAFDIEKSGDGREVIDQR
ncbi:hypothetical protein [Brevundimonas intermedia]|uniref:hypothetical protein n=1 Tax=Brevundimonas intermedia TaxID=74315 RepID=UPI001074A289|nr:hypothetical protein [Brevundimonas intermedia]